MSATVSMERIAETIIACFVNGGLPVKGVNLTNATRLRDLGMGPAEASRFGVFLLDVVGESFPEVENGKVETIDNLKSLIMDALVRKRDRLDRSRACLQCGVVPPSPSRCSRCKSAVYCSEECQLAHWKHHKKLCQPPATGQSDMGLLKMTRVQPPAPDHGLVANYIHSPDNIDANMIICVHGNGDNEINFTRFCGKFQFPMTALMGVRGPIPLGMQGQLWFPEIESRLLPLKPGDKTRINPVWEAAQLLASQITLASKKTGFPLHRIGILGHGQGGVVAVEAARRLGVRLMGVVASGEAIFDEMVASDPLPTRLERREKELSTGGSVDMLNWRVQLKRVVAVEGTHDPLLGSGAVAVTTGLDEDKGQDGIAVVPQWRYELLCSEGPKADQTKPVGVVVDDIEIGNPRSRPKVIRLFGQKLMVRLSKFEKESVCVTMEATVTYSEDDSKKQRTPLLFTTGALDVRVPPKSTDAHAQYLRRKFKLVEHRRYEKRKDVLGSDPQEMSDIYSFFVMASVNKPPEDPKEIKQIAY